MEWIVSHPPPPPPFHETRSSSLSDKVTPNVLLIIIILAIIFFISGLLHLLVRLLFSPPIRAPDEFDSTTAFHGQLQQLFSLHDSGVDQSFIDALPVFNYKEIIGLKDPFDCAVCLCEFEGKDKLRLLPKCSHAFHMDCIDTWLLSHSTCPLCRGCLLNDFYEVNNFSPRFPGNEFGNQSVQENDSGRVVARVSSHLGAHCVDQNYMLPQLESEPKSEETKVKDVGNPKVMSVMLGKFRNVDNAGEGSTSEGNAEARRCFSMGSFAYVMDENSYLQVPIRTNLKKQSSKKPGCRAAMSECAFDSRREFNAIEAFKFLETQSVGDGNDSKSIGGSNRGKFSISKIWSKGKKDASLDSSSRRTFSFRFPLNKTDADEMKAQNDSTSRTISQCNLHFDEETETHSFNSLDSQPNPSYTKRTLLWLMGKENKFVHSSFSSNV